MSFFDEGPSSRSARSLFERPPSSKPALIDYPVPPSAPFVWNDEQLQAVTEVVSWRRDPFSPRFMKMTGPAGVGKTAVTKEIRRQLMGSRTIYSGLTGKAALRLREAIGAKTKTTHSAIYHPPEEVDNEEEAKIDLNFNDVRAGDAEEDMLLVADEASMMGPKFFADVKKSPYSKVLFVGDPYQLSPVLSRAEEAELGSEDYSVFTGLPGPHLMKVMRNGGAVLAAATVVREQQQIPRDSGESSGSRYDYSELPSPQSVIDATVATFLEERDQHVILVWKNENRNLINAIIRHRLGHTSILPAVGEQLVVRKNIHKQGLMNGDVVRCEEVGPEGPTLAGTPTIWMVITEEVTGKTTEILAAAGDFSGTLPYVGLDTWRKALRSAKVDDVVPLTYAYAITCHLAQGSGYRRVTIASPSDFRSAHYNKMTKLPDGTPMKFAYRHLYTGLSRATKRVSLIISQ